VSSSFSTGEAVATIHACTNH